MLTFAEFVDERETIRAKKEAGLPRPWTTDPVLHNNHFCNIDRRDDAFTKWLLVNWLDASYWSQPNRLVAGRYFNSPAILLRFLDVSEHDYTEMHYVIMECIESGERLFNYQAYSRYLTKDIAEKFVNLMKQTHKVIPMLPSLLTNFYDKLQTLSGIGPFLASQITLDAQLLGGPERFADYHTWIPIGPGSKRGLNRHLGYDPNRPLTDDEFKSFMRIMSWEHGVSRAVLEHALCEYDKYCRISNGEVTHSRKYSPGAALKMRGDKK